MGKSELAKQVALRLQQENAFADGVIWIRLTPGLGTAAWDQIAKAFDIDLSILDNAGEKMEILKEILHAVSPLIILDNADDPESLAAACQPLDGKTLLITSRQRVGAAQVIDLEDLPPGQAEELYWTIYSQQLGSEGDAWRRENHRLVLREIVTRLGGHPLSIGIIASKAGVRSWSPEESLADLRDHGIRAVVREPGSRLFADARHENMMKIMSLAVEDLRVPGGANYQGRTLFAVCGALCGIYFHFDELEEVLQRYLKLYERQSREIEQNRQGSGVKRNPIRRILGWEDLNTSEPLPEPDIRGVNEVRQLLSGSPPLKAVFDRLVTLRVVTRHGSRGEHRDRFRLHPLLRDYAWSIMDDHLSPNIWKAVASWTATKVWLLSGRLGDEIDNVRFVLNSLCRERSLPDEYLRVLSAVLPALRHEGQWSSALEIMEAGAAWLQTSGGHKTALAEVLKNLGDLLVRKGDRNTGRQYLEQARNLYVELDEKSHVAWISYLLSGLIHESAPCDQFVMRAQNLRFALENGVLSVAAAEFRNISHLFDFWCETDTVWSLEGMYLRRVLATDDISNLGHALLSLATWPRERGDFEFAAQIHAWVRSLLDFQPHAETHHELLEQQLTLFLWTGDLEAAEHALEVFAASAERLGRGGSDAKRLAALTAWLQLERRNPAAAVRLAATGVGSVNDDDEFAATVLLIGGLLQPGTVQDSDLDAAVSCLSEASRIETNTASYAIQTGLIAADRILRKREGGVAALSDFLQALRCLAKIGSVRHRWLARLETRVVDQVGLAQLWNLSESPPLSPPVSVLPRDLPPLVRSRKDGRLMRLVPAGLCIHGDERLGPPGAVWLPPFYMDVALVSRHDFRAFLTASGQPLPEGWPIDENGDDGPATGVSYSEAVNWCTWAGKVLPNVYELYRAATLGMDEAARVHWLGPPTHQELGPEIERVLDKLRREQEKQATPYADHAPPSRVAWAAHRPSSAEALPAGVTLAQVLGSERPSEQAEHLVELLATSLFLTAAEKEQILESALGREVIDRVTWWLENERPALDELDTTEDPRIRALVDLRSREWRILVNRRLGRDSTDVVDPEEQKLFDQRDPFAFAPPFATTLPSGLNLQECFADELNPEQRSAALFFLERLANTAALNPDQKRSVLAALTLGPSRIYEAMVAWEAMSTERSRYAGEVESFTQNLVALQKAWREWREIADEVESIVRTPGKLFAGQQSLFSREDDPHTGNPYHSPRRWDEPLRQAGSPADLLAEHPLLSFDEHHFLNLLSQSISLSKIEKWRILKAMERLTQEQIDGLIQILGEEREKFSELPNTSWREFWGVYEKHWREWTEILADFLGTQAVAGEVEVSSDSLADGEERENDVNISNLDYSWLENPLAGEYTGNPFAQQPPCDNFLPRSVDIRAMIPAHPRTYFSERRFLQLLSGSVSLTSEEKRRIVHAIPRLTQEQIDGLATILLEERKRFLQLNIEDWAALRAECRKHWSYWPELVLNLLPAVPELARPSEAPFQRLDGSLWHWTSSTDPKGEERWIAGGPELREADSPEGFAFRQERGDGETRSRIRGFRSIVPVFSAADLRDLVPVLNEERVDGVSGGVHDHREK